MELTDLAKRIRYIEVIVRKKVDEAFSGAYASVFKGRGIEFAEVREYVVGDDVSSIDWNVTARYGRPFTKKFVEERQLNLVLAVDVSSSMSVGFRFPSKRDLVAEVSAGLGFSSLRNNDRLSLFTFSSGIEKAIHPRRGRRHVLRILREVLTSEGCGPTNFSEVLSYLLEVIKKRAVVFLISDFFFSRNFLKPLKILAKRHDVIALVVRDDYEVSLPINKGRLRLGDPETGEVWTLDTHKKTLVSELNEELAREREELFKMFVRAGIDYALITPSSGWLLPMLVLFRRREKRR